MAMAYDQPTKSRNISGLIIFHFISLGRRDSDWLGGKIAAKKVWNRVQALLGKQAATKRMMEETLKKLCSQDPTLQVREPQIPNSTTNAKNNDSIKDKQNPIKKKRRSAVKENEGTNVASVEPGGTKSRRNTKRRHHALGMVIGLN
jgi:hypothetical protein